MTGQTLDDAYVKYTSHKATSKQRGIAFELSYGEWREIWGLRLKDRGKKVGQLAMLRTRDEGGYSVGNVRIGTVKENRQEAGVVLRVKSAQIPKARADYAYTPPKADAWMWRKDVFKEYSEDDE